MTTKARRLPSYQNVFILLTLGFSLIALILSCSAQYIWGIEPCKLCKLHRIPYFFILVLSGLALWPNFRKVSIRLIQVAFLVSLGLACYHTLVLAGVVSDSCPVPTGIATIEDFERMLEASFPCLKSSWKMFGLPISGYNLIASILFLYLIKRKCYD